MLQTREREREESSVLCVCVVGGYSNLLPLHYFPLSLISSPLHYAPLYFDQLADVPFCSNDTSVLNSDSHHGWQSIIEWFFKLYSCIHWFIHSNKSDVYPDSDGVERAVAFSQYPHYSCSTTGSSLNSLASYLQKLPSTDALNQINWSLIDRWPLNQGLIESFSDLILQEMNQKLASPTPFPNASSGTSSKPPVLLFSAHSLPLSVRNHCFSVCRDIITSSVSRAPFRRRLWIFY